MKLRYQLKIMDETKVFCIECIKFTGMMNGSGSNNHIGYAWSVTECVGFAKVRKDFVNESVHLKQVELVNEFKIPGKSFFIPASQQKFVTRDARNGKVAGAQVIALADDLSIFSNDLNQNVGIQYYHAFEGQAEERISVSEGKEGSKSISFQKSLSFKSEGKEDEVAFFSTSFTTTSTCLPNKYSGNAMVWSFSVGTIIWRYINLKLMDNISKIRK